MMALAKYAKGQDHMDKIIEVEHLKKSYGRVRAVQDISFYVERGKLFSFLGPNGAGKSTTIDILCTLLSHDGGNILVDGKRPGKDNTAIRKEIGVVFQDHVLDNLLTVKENLMIRAGFYIKNRRKRKAAVKWAAEICDVTEFIGRPYGKLSGGQRRRADIARALVNTPKILFLDEPTTGLDPQTRKNVWDTIEKLRRDTGMTIFLTTHYMEEAALSDFVIVIDNGKIAAKGSPNELKEAYAHDMLRLSYTDKEALSNVLEALDVTYEEAARQFVVKIPETMAAIAIINRAQPYIRDFEVLAGTMDDAFIAITGKEMRE
jgi:multidrug/hemolysin transport system ATP-binding protein